MSQMVYVLSGITHIYGDVMCYHEQAEQIAPKVFSEESEASRYLQKMYCDVMTYISETYGYELVADLKECYEVVFSGIELYIRNCNTGEVLINVKVSMTIIR